MRLGDGVGGFLLSTHGSHWRVLIIKMTDQFTYFKDRFSSCEANRLEMKASGRAERPVRR